MSRFPRRFALPAVLLLAPLLLASCGFGGMDLFGKEGGSGGGSGPVSEALAIVTTQVPAGQCESPYPEFRFEAEGAEGACAWSLLEGVLPDGLALGGDGVLSGQPATAGVYPFVVGVADADESASRSFVLAVDRFALQVDGLRFGDAWSGETITLTAVGATGSVSFALEEDQSGGTFLRLDEEEGHARYVPGSVADEVEDVVVAVDVGTGQEARARLRVQPHPAALHQAAFGWSDVWYVAFQAKVGDHAFPTDWQAVLHRAGLLPGTDRELDELVAFLVQREVHAHLNTFFGRDADGSTGLGLPISFPMERPASQYVAPAPGEWIYGGADRYSVISVLDGSRHGVAGAAFLDSSRNELVENDTTSSWGELGVFPNQLVSIFNASFSNDTLLVDPVSEADRETLRDLLYGREVFGWRAEEIQRIADGFARAVAAVLAHEIGHSLGLTHTNPTTHGSLMNAAIAFYPGAPLSFLEADRAQLEDALPGPGRAGSAAQGGESDPPLPSGGTTVCNLRLLAEPCPCGR